MAIGDHVNTGWDKLNVIFLLDTSGSMSGQRITQLNNAMSVSLEAIRDEAAKKEIDLTVRIAEFNNDAEWIMGKTENGEPIDDAVDMWTDLSAKPAGTNTVAAINLAKECMHTTYLGERAYDPLVILVTDGESNSPADTKRAAQELRESLKSKNNPNKDKITRIAVGVVDADENELKDFASVGTVIDENGIHEKTPLVFNVDNVEKLASLLKNVTQSSVASVLKGGGKANEDEEVVVNTVEDDIIWVE